MNFSFSASDLIKSVANVENHLADDMSKKIYEARLKYFIKRDINELRLDLLDLGLEWTILNLDEMYTINDKVESIVIFGCGVEGKYTLKLLQNSKYKNEKILFCDNDPNKWGKGKFEVISPDELLKNYKKSIVIISSSLHKVEIYSQLLLRRWNQHFPRERILLPNMRVISGKIFNQYFDFFKPNKSEIFVDAGSLDAKTALEFSQWAKNDYEYIYSFEANPNYIKYCEETFQKYNLKGTIINKGLWNESTNLQFQISLTNYGSKIKNSGEETIEVTSLDETLQGNSVTFIKMDIEGAEFKALLGSEKTIKKYHPRLAISIYHKPEDILELPALLLEIQPDYHFALRQYYSNGAETVLYAY